MNYLGQKPIIALAPMADMTDSPFCRVCREVSGKDFVIFREMVSAEAIVRGNEKTLQMCRFEEIERPLVIQLFGGKPEVIVKAAEIICGKRPLHTPSTSGGLKVPDGIDINMGCPVPKIAGKANSGAALFKDHQRACEIVKALKRANLGLPVSIKTRLGWAKDGEILEFASKLEQAGVDAIIIHGRTKKQGYSGQANWQRIAEVKKLVSIPVIANGDINSAEDIQKCLEITGADGVMIGRGALGNPWIFSFFPPTMRGRKGGGLIGGETPPLPSPRRGGNIDELKRVVLRHAQLHLARYGEGSLITFRKHLLYYFRNLPNGKEFKMKLVKVETMEELCVILSGL